jgi:hypothetical protein
VQQTKAEIKSRETGHRWRKIRGRTAAGITLPPLLLHQHLRSSLHHERGLFHTLALEVYQWQPSEGMALSKVYERGGESREFVMNWRARSQRLTGEALSKKD